MSVYPYIANNNFTDMIVVMYGVRSTEYSILFYARVTPDQVISDDQSQLEPIRPRDVCINLVIAMLPPFIIIARLSAPRGILTSNQTS